MVNKSTTQKEIERKKRISIINEKYRRVHKEKLQQYRIDTKARIKLYNREYYLKNKEIISVVHKVKREEAKL